MNLEVDDFMGWNNGPEASNPNPVEPSQLAQLSFIRAVDELVSEVKPDFYRAVPPRNFLVFQKGDDLTRRFFRQVGSRHESAVEAVFALKGDGTFRPVEVTLFGEKPDELLCVDFFYLTGERKLGIMIQMEGRYIHSAYDQKGHLVMLGHFPDGSDNYYDHYLCKFEQRSEIVKPDNDWGFGYTRAFDPKTDRVILTKEDKDKTETFAVPSTLNRQEIIDDLFPKPLLANPAEADPELDDDWKGITLEDTFGINWEIAKPA